MPTTNDPELPIVRSPRLEVVSRERYDKAISEIERLRKALWVISMPDGVDSLSGAREFAKLALTPTPV